MLKTRRMAHSILPERGTSLALAKEIRSTQAAPGGKGKGRPRSKDSKRIVTYTRNMAETRRVILSFK